VAVEEGYGTEGTGYKKDILNQFSMAVIVTCLVVCVSGLALVKKASTD